MSLIKCSECGKEVSSKADECPNCGNPISKKDSKSTGINKKILFIGFILIALAIFAGLTIKQKYDERKQEALGVEYRDNLESITKKILLGASKAEDCNSLIISVWRNTIYEDKDEKTDKYTRKNNGTGEFYNDFNDALHNLFISDEYLEMTEYIEDNRLEVKEAMKDMKNPPEKWKDAYDSLKNYYSDYLEFTNLSLDPSGNLNSYTEKHNDLDSKISKDYNEMEYYFED